MRYAEVTVNSPVARRRTFSYAVPSGITVGIGQPVWVPFGEKVLQGIVLELNPYPAVEETRDIISVIEPRPLLTPVQISLARWISEHYLSPLFDAVKLMLPPGFERKAVTFIQITRDDHDISSLTDEQRALLDSVRGKRIELKKLEKARGKRKTATLVSSLVRKGILARTYEPEPVKIRPKTELYLELSGNHDEGLTLKGKQAVLFEYLKEKNGAVSWAEAGKTTGCGLVVAEALSRKGLIKIDRIEVRREPFSFTNIALSLPLPLTADQQSALDAVKPGLNKKFGEVASPDVFLLHGITGSGKTEIYLQLLAEAVKQGKRGIVLVPEIAMTPQTIERFAARFPSRVAVLHSQLSPGQQYDEWRRIRDGEYDVVIGSRSAVFAPQPELGLIVIDEEHEWTYKQDSSPRYHARDVAVRLAELTGAVVVLGSATPDVTTCFKAENGEYSLLKLPERIVPVEGAPLPGVEVVDMRNELKAGNRSLFSRSLSSAINRALSGHEQVILFLNRRGGAPFVQCRKCGLVLRCRRCAVTLTHHIDKDVLTCHQCNYKTPVPKTCPSCRSPEIKFLGAGTQKLEQEVGFTFPRARRLRWDSDVTSRKNSHEDILEKFRNHEADILIGTQIVAKGLDIPSVTLVGVINADTGLNLPDFRAGERTFQVLTQVAGRAGRGASGGRVIIQTFSPQHYAIRAAAGHDYASFYEQEIEYRRQLRNPPFSRLARLLYMHTNDAVCRREAERMKVLLESEMETRGIAGVEVIGPAPAFIHRLRGRFRWQLILRAVEVSSLLSSLDFPHGWILDIDPMSLVQ